MVQDWTQQLFTQGNDNFPKVYIHENYDEVMDFSNLGCNTNLQDLILSAMNLKVIINRRNTSLNDDES